MTVLFLEDYKRYPGIMLHMSTKNKSFIRLAALYKSMGVVNNAFFLALHNPALEFIDPHDPLLTLEQQAMVVAECRVNFWYWIRECARAPASGGADATPVEANRGNVGLWFCFMNHVMVMLIQIRQTGKSFSTYSLMAYLLNGGVLNTQINWLTKDDKLRREGIQLLKDIMDELPRYMDFRTRNDSNNGEEVTVMELGNKFLTHVPQMSEKRALNQGRGLTTSIIVADEGPFQPNFQIALPAALGGRSAAVDKAKALGAPYGVILATTAGKKDTKEGRFVFEILQESMEWSEKLFDAKNQADLERLICLNSPKGLYQVNITMNHRQLGKTDEWLDRVIAESKQSGDAADRDYFNRWTSGSLSSPFEPAIAEAIRNGTKTTLYTDISKGGYISKWYIPEEEVHAIMTTRKTVMGLDTSDASGGDDISLIITDIETGDTICAGSYNETNLIHFAEWLCAIIATYDNVTTIIERRSTGAAILDYLMYMLPSMGIDPFKRLFNRVVNDAEDDRERFREIQIPMARRDAEILVKYKKTFGFATAGSGLASRTELYSTTLQAAVKRVGARMADKKLIDQVLSLEIRNGRIDHPKGEHDDMVIGWLLCHWLITQGRNLSYYGIDARRVYAGMKAPQTLTAEEIWQQNNQTQLRNTIDDLTQQLAQEPDDIVAMRIEQELRVLTRKVILEVGEMFSVDELIRQTRETRQNRRRNLAKNTGATPGYVQGYGVYGRQIVETISADDNPYTPRYSR